MNGDVEREAPRPRPLSAGIWTLFSWLRRTDRSSSSESVSSVGSDRTVASFDFLAPLNYKHASTPVVLPQNPLTETYKKKLHERNLRRQYDRDITLRRKYGLFREEGLGYDAFSLPSARRFQKDCVLRQDRERRATSESIQRRSAYVPGKRRAPLPPTIVSSATLPRNYKRKRPAPKPPVRISEENKENVEINKILQMNTTSDVDKHLFLSKDISSANKTEKHSKHEIKEVKLRTDKSFLKQIFDNKKRNSAIDTSRIKLLPSISELDKQAAEIIEANKALRASGHNDNSFDSRFRSASAEETWICTTCLRKYKPVVSCCIYCIIKENSNNNTGKTVSTNASNTYTQTDENALKSSRKSGNDDKKKLREMLKEMKDSLPKRPKHNDKYPRDNRDDIVKPTETPTLRIGSTIDENIKVSLNNSKTLEKERGPETIQNHAKEAFLTSQPSSSKETYTKFVTSNGAHINRKSDIESSSQNSNNTGNLFHNISTSKVRSENESPERNKEFLISKKLESHSPDSNIKQVNNNILSSDVKITNKIDTSPDLENINKSESSSQKYDKKVITNELLDNNVQLNVKKESSHLLKEIKESLKKHSPTNSEKEAPTEIPVSLEVSQIPISNTKLPASSMNKDKVERIQLGNVYSSKFVNIDQTKTGDDSNYSNTKQPASSVQKDKVERIQLGNVYSSKIANIHQAETSVTSNNSNTKLPASSENKEKVERIQLGNVYSSKIVKIDQTETGVTSNSSGNISLQTPLKISSLLNPLYYPKSKTSNDKVSDCNFAKDLTPKATNLESNKRVEASLNQQRKLPNMVSTLSLNVQTPSSSNPKLLNEILQKSEANPNDALNVKKCENVDDPKRKFCENTSLEVRTATPNINILDHHDMRRNLINQLEQAISKGDEQLAAEAAAKLAKLKLACSVLSFSSQIVAEDIPKTEILQDNITNEENKAKYHVYQTSVLSVKSDSRVPDKNKAINEEKQQEIQNPTPHKKISIIPKATASTSSQTPNDEIPIEVWVEDKEAARGPIPLRISRKARIGELKRHVETSLGLEIRLQRWIVGRTLCTDDNTPLVTLAGPDLSAPFYLCLVESETNKDIAPQIKDVTQSQIKTAPSEINNAASGDVYTELMKLEQQALVPNTEEFECGVCIEQCPVGAGVVLRECIHTFCRECLVDVIRHCEEPVVTCPAIQCPGALQEREIRAVLSTEEYERWLARGLAAAESGTRNTFHCRTRDCKGWAFCEPEVRRFPCPVCKHTNCVPCQAVHEGETCEQYQEKLREAVSAAESDQTDEGTQVLLKSLISRGEALECPECSAIITKKWGCDWVKCSACKTEICWVTKGRRWGPGGKGDTSDGCRCGVDGKRCHPSCGYCH